MLTKRQNLLKRLEAEIDRFVNQYEAFAIMYDTPVTDRTPCPPMGRNLLLTAGSNKTLAKGHAGSFSCSRCRAHCCQRHCQVADYVKAPRVDFRRPNGSSIAAMEKIDRNEYFATLFYAPGIFEQCHYLMEISNCLIAFYEEPEAMKELIEYITDFELRYAEQVCKYLKPDAFFHHDDWGTQISTFISPEMFEEFLLPSYKKLYGYYKQHGVEIIMHHSDSISHTVYMIEMGIDIGRCYKATISLSQ